ncbi:metal ABC transporter ATP-binding protein [Catenulispora rubra]|uniref:metal ABC transporter ATP-binding protein n=1 Tax=Catenulispora rubra TaxID=280293 RepID=UPI0018925B62|nr:metal ABC transporter ATP-binding protein [Catenulispora rubra]
MARRRARTGAAAVTTVAVSAPDETPAPVVAARTVTVSLGGRRILHGVDLEVPGGQTVALLGANGSGKSTLVKTIVGLYPVDGGRVDLFGTPLPEFKAWQRVGYVPQRTTAAAGVPATVGEVVASGLLSPRGWVNRRTRGDRTAVREALATVGMLERIGDPVASLSGGQQQRVLIARALARRPDLLIMDEPMAGVDLVSQQAFADTLADLSAHGTTILLVLHELGPLAPLIDRTVVLRAGTVRYDGAPIEHGEPDPAHGRPGHEHVHPHAAPDEVPGMPECPPGHAPVESLAPAAPKAGPAC